MNQRLKQLILGLLAVGMAEGIYTLIQNSTTGTFDLYTRFDKAIPFQTGWIWIYVSIFPAFVYASIKMEKEPFNRTLARVLIAQALTFPFFILMPSDYPRPTMVDDGTFYGWAYALMHRVDGSHNTFPSLHVSLIWIIMHEMAIIPAYRMIAIVFSFLITLSVLFTKQHFVYDAIGGIGVYALTLYAPRIFAFIVNHFKRS